MREAIFLNDRKPIGLPDWRDPAQVTLPKVIAGPFTHQPPAERFQVESVPVPSPAGSMPAS